MTLNIWNDIWTKLTDFSNDCYNYIMNHFDNPFLWIIIVVVLVAIGYGAISNLANK